MRLPPCFFAMLLALPAPVTAQEPPAVFTQEIVVTAERSEQPIDESTAAITVVSRDEIERAPAENLGELIALVPGFHVMSGSDLGAVPMISSRGFFGGGEVEYVKLLVDGVPVGDVESGLVDWRRFRTAHIDRLEIVRGPASTFWGDTALGGVIQLFTRRDRAPRGRVSLSAGSFGSRTSEASYARPAGPPSFDVSATASRSEGFRAHSSTGELAADLSLGGPAWHATLSASTRDREEPGPLSGDELAANRAGSNSLFRFDREETRRERAGLTFNRMLGDLSLRFLAHGSHRETDFLRTLLIAAGFGDRAFRTLSTNAAGGSTEAERRTTLLSRPGTIRGGIDAAYETLTTSYREVGEGLAGQRIAATSGSRRRLALFAANDWNLTSRVRISGGVRWDRIDDDFERSRSSSQRAFSPRLGVNVRLGAWTTSFLQLSRAFKAPSIDQRFDPRPFPDFAGGTFTISNPDVLPQRASTAEAGISRRSPRHDWELVAYRTAVEDEIDFDPVSFTYKNIGSSLHRGVETSSRFFKQSRLAATLGYSWTRVSLRSGDERNHQLKNIPEHLVRGGLTVSFSADTRASVQISHRAGRFLDDENTFPLHDATVADLRIEHRIRRVRIRADVLNLTGEKYEELGYALPDFTGTPVPYYLPAPGRTLRTTLEWEF